MNSLKIYYGGENPYVAFGKNQSKALEFAFKFPTWHSYGKDRATKAAINGLERRGSIVVDRENCMFKINDGRG